MYWQVSVGVNMVKGHLDDLPDAVSVNVVHAEGFDLVLAQDALFARVDVAQPDVHEPFSLQERLHPRKLWNPASKAQKE